MLSPRLLEWFRGARRDLPWRRTKDPYRIWISEVMLQQTQVERVTEYYARFLRAFPGVSALAGASLDEVLHVWSGLGYYSRARNLHAASRIIVERHGGRFPTSYEEALRLPGVGAYTAGAVLSIAYGRRLPAVDANARRVLARVLIETDASAASRRRVREAAQAAVSDDHPGEHNQALMELGSLVCLPTRPRCEECCLADVCGARRAGRQEALPVARRRETRPGRVALGLVRRRGRLLIAQRPLAGIWGGLWEFPNLEPNGEQDGPTALRAALRRDFGLSVRAEAEVGRLRYGITNRRIELTAYRCTVKRGRTRPRRHTQAAWVRPSDLGRYAMPAPHRKLSDMLESPA